MSIRALVNINAQILDIDRALPALEAALVDKLLFFLLLQMLERTQSIDFKVCERYGEKCQTTISYCVVP